MFCERNICDCFTGSSKSLSTDASKKAEEAVKTGRLVVTGQLLQMLSNSQRPRSVASASGVDKMRKGPLSWKFHDMSLKDWTGNGTSKSKILPTANVPKLQTETDIMLDTVVENVKVECAGEDETAELVAADTPTSADTFCPKITNIVSLEEMY